jgi:hypothetical protein
MIRFDAPLVTFLANDAILHWALPFLESFRATNPDVALLLIPFDERIDRLAELAGIYRFEILERDYADMTLFGEIAFPRREPMHARLRKLALFDIEAPGVVYLDTDTIVTADLSPLLRRLAATDERSLTYASETPGWVYRVDAPPARRIHRGPQFSTGFLALSGPPIGSATILRTVRENLVEYLLTRAAGVIDQPVINFAADALGIPLGRLDATGLFSYRNWVRDPQIIDGDAAPQDELGRPVAFLHWAGEKRASGVAPHWNRFQAIRRAASRRVASLPASPRTTAPIGIFCKSFAEDFDRLRLMLDTLRTCNIEAIPFALSLPAQQIGLFRERFPDADFPVHADHELTGFQQGDADGWYHQQIVKLCSDRTELAASLFIVDSDFYFIRPFGRDEFVDRDGVVFTRLSPHGHSAAAENLPYVLRWLDGGVAEAFAPHALAELRAGSWPDVSADNLESLSGLCRGTDFSALFRHPPHRFACMSGPVLHAVILRGMRAHGEAGPPAQSGPHAAAGAMPGEVPARLIGVSPWEYIWHAEFLLASEQDLRIRPLPIFHVPSTEAVAELRRLGVTEARLARRYIGVAMAARHFEPLRLDH